MPSESSAILNEVTHFQPAVDSYFKMRRAMNVNCHVGWELQVDLHKFYEIWRGDLMAQATVILSTNLKVLYVLMPCSR